MTVFMFPENTEAEGLLALSVLSHPSLQRNVQAACLLQGREESLAGGMPAKYGQVQTSGAQNGAFCGGRAITDVLSLEEVTLEQGGCWSNMAGVPMR